MNIRPATSKDKDAILSLVTSLAEYERKKTAEVQLTIDKIESHGFGENRFFDILIAEHNKIPVGYVASPISTISVNNKILFPPIRNSPNRVRSIIAHQ